ncbi:hypothetical protein XENOCAPTIV_008717 [Xenoophorus captivus]|uniref:Reverse transcriptase n=1 Tax=Xenoophorus captivus TaxID=1517983 RepID=A0ABV0SEH1_9TELE
MARDLTWGPVQANDGRRAYIPEAGQRDYHIPAVWADRLEDKVELRVKATVGQWANILMMPSYHTLATYQPLTTRYVKALREVTKGRRGEIVLPKCPMQGRKEVPLQVPQIRDREASQVMMTHTLENAYWRGDEIFTKVGGEPYLVDTRAEVKGPYNLITITDLKELNKPWGERRSLSQRLRQLRSRLVKVGSTQSGTGAQEWYKAVDVPEVTEHKLKETDFSPAGKERLRKIITSAKVARFKNDCGDLGPKYVHLIEGGVHPPVRQYPAEPGCS